MRAPCCLCQPDCDGLDGERPCEPECALCVHGCPAGLDVCCLDKP